MNASSFNIFLCPIILLPLFSLIYSFLFRSRCLTVCVIIFKHFFLLSTTPSCNTKGRFSDFFLTFNRIDCSGVVETCHIWKLYLLLFHLVDMTKCKRLSSERFESSQNVACPIISSRKKCLYQNRNIVIVFYFQISQVLRLEIFSFER